MSGGRDGFELDDADREVERQVRAAFAVQRPRPAFVAELGERLRPRESLWSRIFGVGAVRQWAPALALVLVVVGVVALLGNLPRGGATTSSLAPATSRSSDLRGAFGLLPAPAGSSIGGRFAAPTGGQVATRPSTAGGGGATGAPLTAAGTPVFPSQAPVFRYVQPSPEARAAALQVIATRSGLLVQPKFGADGGASGEPSYLVAAGEPVKSDQLAAAAEAFLTEHGLVPAFPTVLKVELEEVIFERLFTLPDGTTVPLVMSDGAPAGTTVTISGGRVSSVSGPLELPLEQAPYPLRPAPSVHSGSAPRLVYVAVPDPDGIHGYFEPAYLFSGAVATQLVSALAASYVRP